MEYRWRALAIPFGSPRARDKQGEYFSPRTKLGIHLGPETRVPLAVHHGQDRTVGPRFVGYCSDWSKDSDGWRCTFVVDDPIVGRRLADTKAPLFASSGAASHLVVRAADGEILQWPLAEVSTTYTPIDDRAEAIYLADPAAEAQYQRDFRLGQLEVLEHDMGRLRRDHLLNQINSLVHTIQEAKVEDLRNKIHKLQAA